VKHPEVRRCGNLQSCWLQITILRGVIKISVRILPILKRKLWYHHYF